jgi:hypothetical protein
MRRHHVIGAAISQDLPAAWRHRTFRQFNVETQYMLAGSYVIKFFQNKSERRTV